MSESFWWRADSDVTCPICAVPGKVFQRIETEDGPRFGMQHGRLGTVCDVTNTFFGWRLATIEKAKGAA